jgi:micrococcal nuclease
MGRFKKLALILAISMAFGLLSGTTIARQATENIEIAYRDIKINIDGTLITPKDVDGNTVEPFIYNGTTYLPVRAVSGALGLDVAWDNDTSTVSLKTQEAPPAAVSYKVLRVVDGDTFTITFNGQTERVRLIGVDTPESVHPDPDKNVEYGKIASEFTTGYLLGKDVTLEFDVQERDQYGRLLAYVWIGGKMFNEVLLLEGHAQVATFPPNVKYVETFLVAQADARERGVGLWAYEEIKPGAPADPSSPTGNVYVTASGSKYHSTPTCSNMKNPLLVTLARAISGGYTRCSKCW